MIKFDFNQYCSIDYKEHNLENIKERFIKDNNMAGWYRLDAELSDIKKCSLKIRENADVFVVIGIGGSYLGAQAIISALEPYFNNRKPEIIFAGTSLSTDYMLDLLEYIKGKSVYVNVISKSGTTLEPSVAFDILLKYMRENYTDVKDRIIVTTDKEKGTLLELAKEEGYQRFIVPDDIGGRYSVLTPVGLLPIAVAGLDIDKLFMGANDCKNNLDDCYKYTVIRDKMYKSGKLVESFNVYEPKLYYFTEWLKQLFAESQGKEDKGLLPISTVNTRDLHSLGQYFQDGSKIMFSTTIFAHSAQKLYLDKYHMDLDKVNEIACLSVCEAHYPHTETNLITMDKIDEYNLGYLLFFFMMSAMLGSYLIDINFYDQPGVNAYKDIMNKKIKDNM